VQIDWTKPVQEVWNLIRGSDPQPGAWSLLNGQEVYIYDAKKHVGNPGEPPGQVITVDANSFTVATQGGAIEVMRVRSESGRKVAAEEFIGSIGLQPGARFGA
jgi:methionyl-tRNA formyltransferase